MKKSLKGMKLARLIQKSEDKRINDMLVYDLFIREKLDILDPNENPLPMIDGFRSYARKVLREEKRNKNSMGYLSKKKISRN